MTNTERSRAERLGRLREPGFFAKLGEVRSLWYETAEEIEEGLAWGIRKRFLLRRISHSMRGCLTSRERECVRLHFFRGLALCEVSRRLKMDASSVHRALRVAIKKLRKALRQPDHSAKATDNVVLRRKRNGRKQKKVGRRPKPIRKNRKKAAGEKHHPASIKHVSRRKKARDPRRKLRP